MRKIKMQRYDFQDLLENMFDALYFVDNDRCITYWNKAAERISGYGADEVVGMYCYDNILQHVDGKGNNLCMMGCPLSETLKDCTQREGEVYLHHKDGHRVPVWVRISPLRDKEGNIVGAAELFTDISPRESSYLKIEELENLAYLDNLTRIANRNYIELEMQARFAELNSFGNTFGILFMDVDNFKMFNDNYGHGTGDQILKSVAKTLSALARPYDLYGRWGGDEMIGIVRNVDLSSLEVIAERVRVLVEKTHIEGFDKKKLNITISIGATVASSEDTLISILNRADMLLLTSKKHGRNCITTG